MSFEQSVRVAGNQQAALGTATAGGCKNAQSYLNQAVKWLCSLAMRML